MICKRGKEMKRIYVNENAEISIKQNRNVEREIEIDTESAWTGELNWSG